MKYSIIIPAHNVEETIGKTIDSILVQYCTDYEIIIVNDASTDKTGDIIKKYKVTNKKIIKSVNLKENKKAGGARNVGIKLAKGEYIIFLDGDDILDEKALEKIENLIVADTPDIVYLGFTIKNGNYEEKILPDEHNSIKEYRISEWKYENVWDICWNKKFLISNNIKFVENRYFEDFLFYYKGVILSKSYKYLNDVTHIYTEKRKGSMTTEISLNKLEDLYYNTAMLLEFMSTLPKKYVVCLLEGVQRNNTYTNELIEKYKMQMEHERYVTTLWRKGRC